MCCVNIVVLECWLIVLKRCQCWSDVYLWLVGCTSVTLSVCEVMQGSRPTSSPLMLLYDIADFIGSCCRFLIDLIIYVCLRININIFHFSFFDNVKYPRYFPRDQRSVQYHASVLQMSSLNFGIWKDIRCSLYPLKNVLPVCPMYLFTRSGHVNR